MTTTDHEKAEDLELPNDRETADIVFAVLSGISDFDDALSEEARTKLVKAKEEFLTHPDPENRHKFVTQIMIARSTSQDDLGWMAFEQHLVPGENGAGWGIEETMRGLAVFPNFGTGRPSPKLRDGFIYDFDEEPNVVFHWDDLDVRNISERLKVLEH